VKPTIENESFLRRFHRLKTEARQPSPETEPSVAQVPVEATAQTDDSPPPPGDDDMPPVETLGFDSDFTGFLSPRVSEGLRKVALRKLFHAAELNVVDGLDEYAEDFTRFEALGDIVTSDMRHQIELAAKREAEQLKQRLLDGDGATEEPAIAATTETASEAQASDTPAEPDAVSPEYTAVRTTDPAEQ
jgi:hypothetical protein